MKTKGQPFARARAMFALIYAAMMIGDTAQRRVAMSGIAAYKSRGHGLGLLGNKHSPRSVAQDKRNARKKRNKA